MCQAVILVYKRKLLGGGGVEAVVEILVSVDEKVMAIWKCNRVDSDK